jgi:hypothetical protein
MTITASAGQTFSWNLRSTTFNNSIVKFVAVTPEAARNASDLLGALLDPTFTYSNYSQATYTIATGIFAGYDLLSISVRATRMATMSSIFLIFPLILVCTALCMVLHQEPAKDSRLSMPLSSITATMAFSYVVANQCPPVSYTTRLHMLIFQTYIFSIAALLINYYLWCVEFAKKELSVANNKKKTLLADSQALAKRLKSFDVKDAAAKDRAAAQKVIVLAEGIHKAAAAAAAVPAAAAKDGEVRQESKLGEPGEDAGDGLSAAAQGATAEAAKAAGGKEAGGGAGNKVAPAVEAQVKLGAFKNEEGVLNNVEDLLNTDEVMRESALS